LIRVLAAGGYVGVLGATGQTVRLGDVHKEPDVDQIEIQGRIHDQMQARKQSTADKPTDSKDHHWAAKGSARLELARQPNTPD
jgi:hypothetical protein